MFLFQTDFTYKHVFFPFTTRTALNLPPLLPSTIHTALSTHRTIQTHIETYQHTLHEDDGEEEEEYKEWDRSVCTCIVNIYGNRMPSHCRMPSPLLSFAIQFRLGWLFCLFRITYKHRVCVYARVYLYYYYGFFIRSSLFVERIHKPVHNERRLRDKESVATTTTAAAPPRIAMYTWRGVLWTSNEHIYIQAHTVYNFYIIIIRVFLFSFFISSCRVYVFVYFFGCFFSLAAVVFFFSISFFFFHVHFNSRFYIYASIRRQQKCEHILHSDTCTRIQWHAGVYIGECI